MKTLFHSISGLVLGLFLLLPNLGYAQNFHIDGYVIFEDNLQPVAYQVVEIRDQNGGFVDAFFTDEQGLFSGDFDIPPAVSSYVLVEYITFCNGEIAVYNEEVVLDSPYLTCSFLICQDFPCYANFNVSQASMDSLEFEFTDISQGEITSWYWDFGDQHFSTEQNPTHVYTVEDHYQVKLTVTGTNCMDQRHRGIFVFYRDCLAKFSHEQTNQGDNLIIQFIDESQGNINLWSWDFGDGESSNEQNPEHHYTGPGEYLVLLHASRQGCWSSTWQTVIVTPDPACFPLFNSQQLHGTNCTVAFTDMSIADSVSNWIWQFGDGNISNEQNPVHIYDSTGIYEVSLEIDGIACNNIFSRTIQVLQSNNCNANFDFLQPIPDVPAVDFLNLSTGDDLEYLWNFGDGATSVEMSPVHVFPSFGAYNVELKIVGFGCGDSITKQVELIEPIPCEAIFSFWSENPESTEVFFTNESVGQVEQHLWDFGDGTFSIEENPVHIYDGPGEFLVELKILAGLCQDSTNQIVHIEEPAFCEASFSISQNYPQSRVISFINGSTGINFSSTWDFGDGNSSIQADPVHEYPAAGEYLVSLAIYTEDDCRDTAWFTLEILPPLSISGSVTVGANLLNTGSVILYKEDAESGVVVFDDMQLNDGYFQFTNLLPGNYILQAFPEFDLPYPVIPKYFPTYAEQVSNWPNAQVFNTNNLPVSVSIHLSSYDGFFDGKASIEGKIVLNGDYSEIPVSMLLFNETGNLRDFRIVDGQNTFDFNKIPYGKYELYPEKAGKNGQSFVIYLSEENPEINDIVFLETNNSIIPDLTAINVRKISKILISPNPANDYILIDFYENPANNSENHIKLYNSEQKLIGAFSFNSNTFKLDVSGYQQGIYFIELTNKTIQLRKKILILHL